MRTELEWMYHWGLGHEQPQLVMAALLPLDPDEQREIVEYYQYLVDRVLN